MLDHLSSRLQTILRKLKGEGRVSESHLDASLREVRLALLEADVHFKVVKDFVTRVREKALGQEVLRSLTPGQQVIKIVRDELVRLLGSQAAPLRLAHHPPTVILMVGLQGSGKTTTTGKLALFLREKGHHPLLMSTDVYRPAALEQLAVIGRALEIPVLDEATLSADPVTRAAAALRQARQGGFDLLLIDTAGRLHIDEELMDELERIKAAVQPSEILLVADAMTGQDAVNSARDFDRRLSLSGVILTKMDGDARGGAALSIQSVTGKPIKFIGVGEKYHALEVFHPDRMAGRILGMGDVLSLIEKAEEVVQEEEALQMLKKMRRDEFTLQDFAGQLRQIRRLGPLEEILGLLPQFRQLKNIQVNEQELIHLEAMIGSMTPAERQNYRLIKGSRRRRIALGSGRPVSEVNRLLRQFEHTRKIMKQLTKGRQIFWASESPSFAALRRARRESRE